MEINFIWVQIVVIINNNKSLLAIWDQVLSNFSNHLVITNRLVEKTIMNQIDNYFTEVYRTIDETFSYLGKKWNIKIIKALFCDYKHFKDFLEINPGLSSKVLSERLKELEQKGIIEKKVVNSGQVQTEYHLTGKGLRLNRIVFEMFSFALEEVKEPNIEFKTESKESLKEYLNLEKTC